MAPPPRPYDIVVFGATGDAGSAVARYLGKHGGAGLKWALAGRDAGKLERLKASEASLRDVPTLHAEVHDAASMGAFLLGAGTKGKRRSLPNSRIMIHQPLGGAQGQAADIEIQAKEILFIRALLCEYIADYTGQPVEKIEDDCDRDFFMTPEEAKDYGIIDEVLSSKMRVPNPARPELLAA